MKPIVVRLHKRLYRRAAIDAAVEAFSELCKATVRRDEPYWVVELREVDPDVADVIGPELANWALQETIERRR